MRMLMTTEPRPFVVGIRLDAATKAALEKDARTQNRTLSNLVATICRDYSVGRGLYSGAKKTATT